MVNLIGGRRVTKIHKLALIGMPGAGKTTVGAKLAARLGWRWIDSDREIERAVGMPVSQYINLHGEPAFRRQESRLLDAIAELDYSLVLSVGGGAVTLQETREKLCGIAYLVWLRCSFEDLLKRLGRGEGRPLLVGNIENALKQLYLERTPLYEGIAQTTVDVDGLDPEMVTDRVMRAVGRTGIW